MKPSVFILLAGINNVVKYWNKGLLSADEAMREIVSRLEEYLKREGY